MKLNFNEKKKILILCTGNSCRSQMAEGFARKSGWLAFSAGIKPEIKVNPFAVKVMDEVNIDISNHIPQGIDDYLSDEFYLIVTVCDNAQKYCPTFTGNYIHQIHHSFQEPHLLPRQILLRDQEKKTLCLSNSDLLNLLETV